MTTPLIPAKRASNHSQKSLIWPPLKIGQWKVAKDATDEPLAAFELALQDGAEGVTLDVQLSPHGVPVVICDASQRRRTARGDVQGAPAPIALLKDVLLWVRDQKCQVLVAINHPTPDAVDKVLKVIGRAGVTHLTRVIANSIPGLRRAHKLGAKVHLGLRFAGRSPTIPQAASLGAEVLLPHWKSASPSFIRRAHRACMLVIPWVVNNPRLMHRTILDGVDGIITNYPARLTETVVRLQKTARP